MNLIRAVKGMNDLFSKELALWNFIEKTAHDVFSRYGFSEIRTPIVEDLGLFVRSVGEGTDIVEKEMYVLKDRDDSLLCLRPENTAGVVRALIEHKIFAQENELKAYYLGPMFRRERPQKGRLRQFHQIGAEVYGIAEPTADVELMAMLHQYFTELGIKNLKLNINSLGEASEREVYVTHLVAYYERHFDQICEDCKTRLKKNPLRLLDCKNPKCIELSKSAPQLPSYLEPESRAHFEAVQSGLTKLNIDFEVAPRLVRGIDYYSRTVFEINAVTGLGSQNAVGAGGRYDALIANLGGPKVPALGFALGIERIAILLTEEGIQKEKSSPTLTFVCADPESIEFALAKCIELRARGVFAEFDHKGRSVKSQMRRADKMSSKAVVVLGETERSSNHAQLKTLSSGETQTISLDCDSIVLALQPS